MAAASSTSAQILDKLNEIEAYLERRKARAGEAWETCADFNNRLNDFVNILAHFNRISSNTSEHTITYSDACSKLPPLHSSIWRGLISNEYRNLRHELQELVCTDFNAALTASSNYQALFSMHIVGSSVKEILSSRLIRPGTLFRTATTMSALPRDHLHPTTPILVDLA